MIYIYIIELKYILLDNLVLKVIIEGCVGRVFGVIFNLSVLVGWVMCEDGGFY